MQHQQDNPINHHEDEDETESLTSPETPVQTKQEEAGEVHTGQDDDDGFGDFDDFVQPQEDTNNPESEDHFGDFDEYTHSDPIIEPMGEQPAQIDTSPIANIVQSLSNNQATLEDLTNELDTLFTQHFPSPLIAEDDVASLLSEKQLNSTSSTHFPNITTNLIVPNPLFKDHVWYMFWNQLYEDTEFTNKAKSSNFRCADSETRKVFLDALGFTIVEQSESSFADSNSASIVDASPLLSESRINRQDSLIKKTDLREQEFAEAKRLAGISEGELNTKSTSELEEILSSVIDYTHKMQEQSAFWLDAKEQLLMDAEIHNKMIASLVQFAATQQAKSPSTTNFRKKKGVFSRK